ncbi:MAG: prolipoprotein diacylglyceryl transferase [Chloroflexi bacterium]|nr:prolipoprotein diacylglyceryl transferase [Chloroflexota bacterium]
MPAIAFRIGNTPIYTYSLLLTAGLLAGLVWFVWRARRGWGAEAAGWAADAFLAAAAGGLVGGRAAYVAANWEYYQENLAEVTALWRGGLAFAGALAGGWLALWLFWRLSRGGRGVSFGALTDQAALALALGTAFGWLGCLASGVAYGRVAHGPLAFLLPDVFGIVAPRYATQPLGLALTLLVFVALRLLERRRPPHGVLWAAFLLLYGGGLALLEGLRGDETLYLGAWRAGQLAGSTLALAGLALLLWSWQGRSRAAGEGGP